MIVGASKPDVTNIITEFCRENTPSLEQAIKTTGPLSYEEIPDHLASANLAWHFTPWDWCPNSVLEQMASGNPVICASSGGTSELVGPAGISISIPQLQIKPDLQRKAVQATNKVWQEIKTYSLMASQRASTEFNVSKMALSYENLFDNIGRR